MKQGVLNITNGDAFNESFLLNFSGTAVPFREAMMDGPAHARIFSEEFIALRAQELKVSREEYREKMHTVIALQESEWSTLHLWFGTDTFCQMNLLTLLAYLEQINYGGQVLLHYIDDATFEVLKEEIPVPLGPYQKLYEDVFLLRRVPDACGVLIPDAVALYFDYCSDEGLLARTVRENATMDAPSLVSLLLEISSEYGLSDLQAEKLIKKYKAEGQEIDMKPQFICAKDFSGVRPKDVFHKEMDARELGETDERFFNRHILFRKKFCLTDTQGARLKITADDYYKLYINGKFVTMGPAPSYPHCYNYNELDVSAYLRVGENTVAVHTYYQGLINRVWVSGDRRQMLWCELSVAQKPVLVSDTTWRTHEHTGYTSCGKSGYETQFLERYDSRAPEADFFAEDFDDSAWENASLLTYADYTLVKQSTPTLTVYKVAPLSSTRVKDTIRLDFGQEMVGTLCAVAKGRRGDTLLLRYAEELNEDGSLRYETRCNCTYAEEWILSGGEDTLHQYDYKAFRYAEIILPPDTEVSDISMLVRHFPYEERAVFPTEDEALGKILRLCADTIKYGTQEIFVDCPTREKGQYLGDVSIAARAHAILTADTGMMKKALRDFCHSCFICPGMMAVSTSSLMQEIADYSLQFPAQLLWVYKRDGDEAFLRECEPTLTAMYEYFRGYEREDGLIENIFDKWNMVDWPENLRDGYDFPLTRPIGEGIHAVPNAFYIGFLQATDEIYTLLGMPKTGRSEAVARAFTATFYSPKMGLFCDTPALSHSAVHTNILSLLFGLGTPEDKERMIALIREKKLTSMGVYMAYFALAALVKEGAWEAARALTVDPACWLNMLREGATTTFEAWGKDQKWNTSLFHPWATAPIVIFAKDTLPY